MPTRRRRHPTARVRTRRTKLAPSQRTSRRRKKVDTLHRRGVRKRRKGGRGGELVTVEMLEAWIYVQNVLCKDYEIENSVLHTFKFGQRYYTLPMNGYDECEKYSDNQKKCQDLSHCVYYKKTSDISEPDGKCVNKTRLKLFGEVGTVIDALHNPELHYTFLSTELLDFFDSYYYIMRCHNTADKTQYLLVGFSTGNVITNFDILNEIESSKYESLYTYIQSDTKVADHKIILCGHSLGCVMALRFGQFVRKRDVRFFDERCIVVGSSPFKCLTQSERMTYSQLPNVHIFMCKGDPFCARGPDDGKLYRPITMIDAHQAKEREHAETIARLTSTAASGDQQAELQLEAIKEEIVLVCASQQQAIQALRNKPYEITDDMFTELNNDPPSTGYVGKYLHEWKEAVFDSLKQYVISRKTPPHTATKHIDFSQTQPPVATNEKTQSVDWEPNTASKNCRVCNNNFTLLKRKHHCRTCGRLVCNTCAPKRSATRTCRQCANLA